jgi:hypothetical protein
VNEISWDRAIDKSNGHLMLPAEKQCRIVGAASPLKDDAVATSSGDVPARIPQPVIIDSWPAELRALEFELAGDLHLHLPDGNHDVEIRVHSLGLSGWFAATGGCIRSLIAVDSFVGGLSVRTSAGGLVFLAIPTSLGKLRMECVENNALLMGWIEADEIRVTGSGPLLIVDFPMSPAANVKTQALSVESHRIVLGSTLLAGRIAKHTRIACESDEALVVLGDTMSTAETSYLTVEGGTLRVLRGEVGPLHLVDVDVLEVGRDLDPDATKDVADAARQAIASELGYGLVTQVTGSVRQLTLGYRAVVSGDARSGFSAQRIAATPTAEVSGLDARNFNLYSAGVLRDIRRLGLWVDPSTRGARRHFESEVLSKASEPDPALFELAHRRKQLLRLAIDTQQDGHTLSVLREAEKDARRASLSWRSRERVLLEAWRRLLGYGERIVHPLAIGAGLIALLAIGHVGWGRFWSTEWWSGWAHIDRVNSVINFALPGIDAFGISGIGGFWGVTAKVVPSSSWHQP